MSKKTILIIVFAVILSSPAYFVFKSYISKNNQTPKKELIKIKPKEHKLYGIKTDNYTIETGRIKANEFLSTLFKKHRIIGKLQTIFEKNKRYF